MLIAFDLRGDMVFLALTMRTMTNLQSNHKLNHLIVPFILFLDFIIK